MVAQRHSDEDSLAMRAAWLHYGGGLSQTDVAKRLGIPKVKAHRLIVRASQEGAVKVTFDGEIAECVSLEMAISDKFDLGYCEVAPDLDEASLPTRALGIAGAAFLTRELANPSNEIVGVGNGRTLSACIRTMASISLKNTKFVSLMGGLTRNFAANPHDVMHRLAERTGAEAYFMPVPFYANSREDRDILLAQRGVPDVMAMARSADLKVVGIGTAGPDAQMVQAGVISADIVKDIHAAGGVGELVGHFFTADGDLIDTAVSNSVLSVGPEGLRTGRAIAIAGGADKANAIRAILKSGFLDGLITDEATAKMLLHPQT